MSVEELNVLEVYYLTMINWSLYIDTQEFERYKAGFLYYVSINLPAELAQLKPQAKCLSAQLQPGNPLAPQQ